MKGPATEPADRLLDAATRLAGACRDDMAVTIGRLDDDVLLAMMTDAAAARDAVDVILSLLAAEVSRRSSRELGYDGLAQRKGHRTVTALVQNITGQSRADVGRALRTGEDLRPTALPPADADGARPPASEPPAWLDLLRSALRVGTIGQSAFQAIRTGLGEPPVERYPHLDPQVLPEAWAAAVQLLLEEAVSMPVEDLRAAARTARDRLDPVGVTLRFEERFAARSFRAWIDEHGQHHARIVFDDDAAAWVHAVLSAALRPRRGPRFVDSTPTAREDDSGAREPDERTNEQLHYDTMIAILRTGALADPQQAFGDRQPGVRIVVEASAIGEPDGAGTTRVVGSGHLEDGGSALPAGVVESYLCDAGSLLVTLDSCGRPLDVGRRRRLFTTKQRIAIAARDGGCLWPGCGAPVSWCEYHHIDHWQRDHGSTNVDGVPLCRNCHLRLHNQRWRITRERDPVTGEDAYRLHPPPDAWTGERGQPTVLRTRSPRRFAAA